MHPLVAVCCKLISHIGVEGKNIFQYNRMGIASSCMNSSSVSARIFCDAPRSNEMKRARKEQKELSLNNSSSCLFSRVDDEHGDEMIVEEHDSRTEFDSSAVLLHEPQVLYLHCSECSSNNIQLHLCVLNRLAKLAVS